MTADMAARRTCRARSILGRDSPTAAQASWRALARGESGPKSCLRLRHRRVDDAPAPGLARAEGMPRIAEDWEGKKKHAPCSVVSVGMSRWFRSERDQTFRERSNGAETRHRLTWQQHAPVWSGAFAPKPYPEKPAQCLQKSSTAESGSTKARRPGWRTTCRAEYGRVELAT